MLERTWKPHMLTLGIITRNSVKRNGEELLRLIIHRACVELPVSHIIISDAESSDGTVNVIVSEAGRHNVPTTVITDYVHSRAWARSQVLLKFINEDDNELFMFLDDDAFLRRGWWGESKRLLESGCDAVWGINHDAYGNKRELLNVFGIGPVEYALYAFAKRGGTHDLLMTRSAAVKLSKVLPVPTFLHTYEDAYIIHALGRVAKVCINRIGIIHIAKNSSGGLLMRDPTLLLRKLTEFPRVRYASLYLNGSEFEIFRERSINVKATRNPLILMYAIVLKLYSHALTLFA